jgi:hypothetical protein
MRGNHHSGTRLTAALALLAGLVVAQPVAGALAPTVERASQRTHSDRADPVVLAGQAGEVLGFEVGEERHYALGPPAALQQGESARWSMQLRAVQGSGRDLRATFDLQHVREAPRELSVTWRAGEVTHAQVDAELVVNAHGAPLQLTYTSQRHIYDVGDELFQVEYSFHDGRYEKRVVVQGTDWDLDIELIEHANLDPRLPLGLFAFAPSSLDCMEWRVGTLITQRTGTGDVSAAGAGGRSDLPSAATAAGMALAEGACYESNTDPAFANPALASLAMPLLWEQRGDSELVLFSPLRPDLVRGQGNGIPVTFSPIIPVVPNMPGSSVFGGVIPGLDLSTLLGGGGTDGDKDRARDPSRYFFPRRLSLSERRRIDVGARTMEALPLQVAGYAGTVWVDDWGKVVRLDVAPLRHDDAQRWVRLLHPNEY